MLCSVAHILAAPSCKGAEDAGGAAELAAASESDEGFEMLDAGPPADAGKLNAGTRSGACQALDVPLLPGVC